MTVKYESDTYTLHSNVMNSNSFFYFTENCVLYFTLIEEFLLKKFFFLNSYKKVFLLVT